MSSIVVRALELQRDLERLQRFDTGFVTSVVCDVEKQARGFSLIEKEVVPPLRKSYAVEWSELAHAHVAIVAELAGELVGVASLKNETWNRRAVVSHLYVDAVARGKGVGTRLVQKLRARASELEARQLFVETQNVNHPAIRFYERNGFTLVGLDTSLYDFQVTGNETALYFSQEIGESSSTANVVR